MRLDHVSAQWRERDWLIPFAAINAAQLLFWLVLFGLGLSPKLPIGTYGIFSTLLLLFVVAATALGLVLVMMTKREAKPIHKMIGFARAYRYRLAAAVVGTLIVSIGSSAFTANKSAMILAVPPFADPFLAVIERTVLGVDGWELFVNMPYSSELNRLYTLWMPIQLIAIFGVPLMPPSREKAQALVSYSACWLLLGTFTAYALSSVGPVYYDRVVGGGFADLPRHLQGTDAGRISEWLWQATHGEVLVATGISAMPSMHVAMTLWLALVLRRTPIAFLAWAYLLVIFIGSVALGWHYASDGLVAVAGVALIWRWSGKVVDALKNRSLVPFEARPVPAPAAAAGATDIAPVARGSGRLPRLAAWARRQSARPAD